MLLLGKPVSEHEIFISPDTLPQTSYSKQLSLFIVKAYLFCAFVHRVLSTILKKKIKNHVRLCPTSSSLASPFYLSKCLLPRESITSLGDKTGRDAGWRLTVEVIHDPGVRGGTVTPEGNASSRRAIVVPLSSARYRLESSAGHCSTSPALPGLGDATALP